ncbi:MAG: type IV toxin-antitoxin system AbiEi family antitoxin domain-containing protein [Bacteroidales bacterium]|nr:type IV toxin-antitoxin system AbiEi family antitoxin domain-containing protein [Bacteroidales bacterium]
MTIEKRILEAAATMDSFSAADIEALFRFGRPRLNWYLSRLAENGKLVRTGRGLYTVTHLKKVFKPEIGEKARSLYAQFNKEFPEVGMCVYEGPWLFQFMHHLPSNQVVYIEIEKDVAEMVFHHLQDEGEMVYLRPDADLIYKYVNMDRGAVFVKNLTTESPLQTIDGIKVPTLEKLLVDMYCDPDFYYLQDGEYHHIMHNARSRYAINRSRLLRYARRRNVVDRIQSIYDNSEYDID